MLKEGVCGGVAGEGDLQGKGGCWGCYRVAAKGCRCRGRMLEAAGVWLEVSSPCTQL